MAVLEASRYIRFTHKAPHPLHTVSIASVASNQSNALSNPVNAAHFSEIKARIELAARQKAPVTPGTDKNGAPPVMPGSEAGSPRAPGSVFQAYA